MVPTLPSLRSLKLIIANNLNIPPCFHKRDHVNHGCKRFRYGNLYSLIRLFLFTSCHKYFTTEWWFYSCYSSATSWVRNFECMKGTGKNLLCTLYCNNCVMWATSIQCLLHWKIRIAVQKSDTISDMLSKTLFV